MGWSHESFGGSDRESPGSGSVWKIEWICDLCVKLGRLKDRQSCLFQAGLKVCLHSSSRDQLRFDLYSWGQSQWGRRNLKKLAEMEETQLKRHPTVRSGWETTHLTKTLKTLSSQHKVVKTYIFSIPQCHVISRTAFEDSVLQK